MLARTLPQWNDKDLDALLNDSDDEDAAQSRVPVAARHDDAQQVAWERWCRARARLVRASADMLLPQPLQLAEDMAAIKLGARDSSQKPQEAS